MNIITEENELLSFKTNISRDFKVKRFKKNKHKVNHGNCVILEIKTKIVEFEALSVG